MYPICFCKSRYEHNKTEETSKLRHDIMDVNQICFCKSRYEHNKTEVTSKLRHDIMDVNLKNA